MNDIHQVPAIKVRVPISEISTSKQIHIIQEVTGQHPIASLYDYRKIEIDVVY